MAKMVKIDMQMIAELDMDNEALSGVSSKELRGRIAEIITEAMGGILDHGIEGVLRMAISKVIDAPGLDEAGPKAGPPVEEVEELLARIMEEAKNAPRH